ncbi:MAG: hypothetical protein RL172_2772 [Bacteroidota bacterium]|jgi:hypothetical protein
MIPQFKVPLKYRDSNWLKLCDVIALTGYSASTIARLRNNQVIHAEKPYEGGNWRYLAQDVFILAGMQPGQATP